MRRTFRRIWVRSALYGLGAVVTVMLAAWVGPIMPRSWAERVTDGSVRGLLEIMASSMLVVATFSLGTMVTAFTAAASVATPRASTILIDDPISQNVLATFVGAFVFSIIGLIALSMGLFGGDGRVVLLFVTIGVILMVITTLFGWLDYLANMVRLGEILNKVETRAFSVMEARAQAPFLNGRAMTGPPEGAFTISHSQTGYVCHLDVPALQDIAAEADGAIHVALGPGDLVDPSRPAAWSTWLPDRDQAEAIRAAFTIGRERSFDQDPRYCLIVLCEVASRALSPGVNDPGTAIGVIGRLQRVLSVRIAEKEQPEAECGRVHVPSIDAKDLFEDAFGPLARDGAALVEVGMRLQRTLAALARMGGPAFAAAALVQSERALAQARAKLILQQDVERLASLADDVRAAGAQQ